VPHRDDDRQAEPRKATPLPRQEAAVGPVPRLPKVWMSEELFGDDAEVFISHEDQLYRLRRTRNGKLILCK
jgi:hemin uptake protein HemP